MKKVLIDSSFYIALTIFFDSCHTRALELKDELASLKIFKITTEDFIKESLTVISQRASHKDAIEFYNIILPDTEIISISKEYFYKGLNIFLESGLNKNISLVDCVAKIVYEDIKADGMLTFDR